MGEGPIPLPKQLVQKIVGLEFVEMAELIPEAGLFEAPGGNNERSGVVASQYNPAQTLQSAFREN